MVVPRNFKNGPLSPRQGGHAFFVKKNLQTGPRSARRGGSAAGVGRSPPNGRQAPPRATGSPLYISPPPSFPPHLSSKNPPKIQKKERREEKGSGEALPDSAFVICWLVHLIYVFFHWYCRVI